jgi:hypothetical protein
MRKSGGIERSLMEEWNELEERSRRRLKIGTQKDLYSICIRTTANNSLNIQQSEPSDMFFSISARTLAPDKFSANFGRLLRCKYQFRTLW